MIYLIVQGGLGNQLFQAGFGLLIEKLSGREVRFLTHRYQDYSYGFKFELNNHFPHLKNREMTMNTLPENTALLRESDDYFNPIVTMDDVLQAAHTQENLLLDGYWGNEEFWGTHIDFYREILTPKPIDSSLINQGKQIQSRHCIGIHVRRHEYGHLGIAQMDYYRNALKQIRRECGALPAVVFTDEYNVCAFEFRGMPDVEVLRGEADNPVRDFFLLTQCKHFIASNSTFSCLATVLGETEHSIVYYPYPICVFHNNTLIESREKRWRIVEGAVRRA